MQFGKTAFPESGIQASQELTRREAQDSPRLPLARGAEV